MFDELREGQFSFLLEGTETAADIDEFIEASAAEDRGGDHGTITADAVEVVFVVSVNFAHIFVDKVEREVLSANDVLSVVFAVAANIEEIHFMVVVN